MASDPGSMAALLSLLGKPIPRATLVGVAAVIAVLLFTKIGEPAVQDPRHHLIAWCAFAFVVTVLAFDLLTHIGGPGMRGRRVRHEQGRTLANLRPSGKALLGRYLDSKGEALPLEPGDPAVISLVAVGVIYPQPGFGRPYYEISGWAYSAILKKPSLVNARVLK